MIEEFPSRKRREKLDPLEDKVISELVWDVFCYVQRFKKKWLKTIPLERI